MTSRPLFVHCCHCRWCQRETGASFALNAMIEADRVVTAERGAPETVNTPSNSGKGQKIVRCPTCRIALWSNYAGAGDAVRFVRVGTLDEPGSPAAGHPHLHGVEAAVGASFRRGRRRWRSTTTATSTGRQRGLDAGACCSASRDRGMHAPGTADAGGQAVGSSRPTPDVIPAKTTIQGFRGSSVALDPRFRGGDNRVMFGA